MNCTQCQYPKTYIIETRLDDMKNVMIRRRECPKCGHRDTTHEAIRPRKVKQIPLPTPIYIK